MQALMLKWFDWPPVWGLAFALAILVLGLVPMPIGFGAFGPGLALACLALGLALIGKALLQMRAARTTLNPRKSPDQLVTDGVFAISRNPIYLGDALILAGLAFGSDNLLSLAFVAGFVWVVSERFIAAEEERILDEFPETAEPWFAKVRRWI